MNCLIIGYSQPNRKRERQQFFSDGEKSTQGFKRYLRVNYLDYENDILLPNHVASLANKLRNKQTIEKTGGEYFKDSDLNYYSSWQIPLLG